MNKFAAPQDEDLALKWATDLGHTVMHRPGIVRNDSMPWHP